MARYHYPPCAVTVAKTKQPVYGNLSPVSVDGNVAPVTLIGSNIFCPLAKKAFNKHTAG